MLRLILVVLAGGIGTGLRYGIGLVFSRSSAVGFPFATMTVNIVGCFFMGLVMQCAADRAELSENFRIILTSGLLGGFTTYSAFNFEWTRMVAHRAWGSWLAYTGGTLALCYLAGWMGSALGKRVLS